MREEDDMPGELSRRASGGVVSYRTVGAIRRISTEARLEQTTVRASSAVGEFAVSEVEYLKRVQSNAEHANPDAADAVATIINTTVASIARRVAQFGNEVGW